MKLPYLRHLQNSDDLITTYAARRAGFVALALEKNRRAEPYIAEARALQTAVLQALFPSDLLTIPNIENGLLTAAGLSEKALAHLEQKDKEDAIAGLIKNFLEPAGDKFVEELIFRFLLIRGDALGGAMRNIGGVFAQRKLTRAILASLTIAGIDYSWQRAKTREWVKKTNDDSEIDLSVRGIYWKNKHGHRTLIYNLTVPHVKNNVDFCLFELQPEECHKSNYSLPKKYIALGELKGGIDPAGADEHWKTARTSLNRIREAFSNSNFSPHTFYIGSAIERKMAGEIWGELESGILSNAANLNDENQVASISNWLCSL